MDAETILRIRPALTEFLHEFDGCLGRVTNRGHATAYVVGQLSDLDRKSIEPMADAAGVPPRTLQEFLGLLKWDESAARDRLRPDDQKRRHLIRAAALGGPCLAPGRLITAGPVRSGPAGFRVAINEWSHCAPDVAAGAGAPCHPAGLGDASAYHHDRYEPSCAGRAPTRLSVFSEAHDCGRRA